MNSYPPMGVPGSASIAQFYQQAAAVSAASAGVGVDSLGSACSQLSSSVGGGQSGLPDITRHPWLVTGKFRSVTKVEQQLSPYLPPEFRRVYETCLCVVVVASFILFFQPFLDA